MFKNKLKTSIGILTFLTIFCASIPIYGQTDKSENIQCTASPNLANEPKTYLVGADKLSKEDEKRIENNYGKLDVPGEDDIKAAIERRKSIQSARDKRVAQLESNYNQWIKNSPNATAEEKEKWRKLTDDIISSILYPPKDKKYLAMKSFDWRKHGLDVGKLFNQGIPNTQWH